MIHFLIYKTTHLPTGKFYIGRHRTESIDDGYYGSGKIIKDYLKTHPIEEFERIILAQALTFEGMKLIEAELITEAYENPLCINVGKFIDSLPMMSDEGKLALSQFRKAYKMPAELKARISKKLKGRKLTSTELANRSWTTERKSIRSREYANEGNPRALSWTILFEDGRSISVKSLKSWCRDNDVKYTSLLASETTNSYYNGMKLSRV